MSELNFSTGVKEYTLNGACTIRFNPTDPTFVESVFNAFTELDERHEQYSKSLQELSDGKEIFQLAKDLDSATRATIDGIFGTEVCEPLFGNLSVYASADGLPLWANLMLTLIEEMDDSFTQEKKAANPRILKYTEKFKKK